MILVINYPVPSLNKLFGMNHWQRRREKKAAQDAFESALLAIEGVSATSIISPQSTSSTASAMLESFRKTLLKQSITRSARSKSAKKRKSARRSK